jgi:hypothetical protein
MFMQANQTAAESFSNSLCRDIGHDWRTTTAPNYRTCTRTRCRAAQYFHQGRWMNAPTRSAKKHAGTLPFHLEQAVMTWADCDLSQQGA